VVTIAKFKEETGVMHPGVWCKGHDIAGRAIYDMLDVDPEQNEVSERKRRGLALVNAKLVAQLNCVSDLQTALQIYTSNYKALPPDESFALLRKATKLDQYLPPPRVRADKRECSKCGVDVSPKWYDAMQDKVKGEENGVVSMMELEEQENRHSSAGNKLCHLCWFRR
jgi:hypothetical protein